MKMFTITEPVVSNPNCRPIDIILYTLDAMNVAKVDKYIIECYNDKLAKIINDTPAYNLVNAIVEFSAKYISYCNELMRMDEESAKTKMENSDNSNDSNDNDDTDESRENDDVDDSDESDDTDESNDVEDIVEDLFFAFIEMMMTKK